MSNGLKVALLALACFATSISEFAIVGMIDVVAESAGVSAAMAGQLLTAFALSGGIGVLIVVMALAKLERRDLMTASLAMVVVGCALMSVVTDFYLMMVSRVFMAIGAGVGGIVVAGAGAHPLCLVSIVLLALAAAAGALATKPAEQAAPSVAAQEA